ncbi:hypothetical protein [uncultured Desulfuromusa sp.]|uniref:hypothetical protein n=1 Tax=uncultured Desulfuromusa sp. TaxID=219183 RepID=UPI002AA65AFC|nr:hypothetical protein [uncultured Desulfuromusa sp.]
MKLRCPVCHTSNSLEAYVSDEAGHQLLRLLVSTGPLMQPLVHYLGLFRPAQRDLSYSRSVKLVNQLLALNADHGQLAIALTETVESMRAKQQAGEIRPLKNHNYLKRVLETVAVNPIAPVLDQQQTPQPRGKRAQGMASLVQWAGDDWLRNSIADGLIAMIGLGRDGAPGADTITITASLWETMLIEAGMNVQDTDVKRIRIGFKELLNRFEKWPEPKDLLVRLPRRPERKKLDQPPPVDDIQKGKEFFKTMGKSYER